MLPLLVEELRGLLDGKATTAEHLIDFPAVGEVPMINGSLADNVLDSLDQFPLVVVGAAGHPMSTIALLANRMGHEVEIRDASHQVAIYSERGEMFGFVTPATALIRSVLVGPAGIIDARNEMEEEEGEEEEEEEGEEGEEEEGEGEGEDAGAHHAAQPPALAPVAQQDAHMPNLAGADIAARARAPARKFMRYPLDRVPIALEFNSHHQVSMLLVSLGTTFGPGIRGAGWARSLRRIRNAPVQDFDGWFQAITATIISHAAANANTRPNLELAFNARATKG